MKRAILSVATALCFAAANAQESQTFGNFLRLPVNAHAAALGGDNITLTDDNPSIAFHNPALACNAAERMLGLGAMTYMQGAWSGSACYSDTIGGRGTWTAMGQFMDYGEMSRRDEAGTDQGKFAARDIAVGGAFAYALTDRIAAGVSLKMVYSSIAEWSAVAVGVDLGANYYDEDEGWSVSAVARNLGGQLKPYEDTYEKLPFDLQLGASKTLGYSPLTIHATLTRLNCWDEKFINHIVIGADVRLGEQLYLAAGYSPRCANQMGIISAGEEKAAAHGAGLSVGGGLRLERFQLHLAYAKYHVSSNSLSLNISYRL